MNRMTTLSLNGHHADPAAAPKPKRAAKPRRKRIPYRDRNPVFESYDPRKFERYQDFLDRLPRCPGFRALEQVIQDARRLQQLAHDTLATYGPGSRSTVSKFLRQFDPEDGADIWDSLTAMVMSLSSLGAIIDCGLPMGRRR